MTDGLISAVGRVLPGGSRFGDATEVVDFEGGRSAPGLLRAYSHVLLMACYSAGVWTAAFPHCPTGKTSKSVTSPAAQTPR